MKKYNSLLWGVASIVIGLLILIYPVGVIEILIRIVGLVLLSVGAIQLITFFAVRRTAGFSWTAIPLGGVLAVVLGIMLVASPATFASFFMIMVGILLMVLAVVQVVGIAKAHKTNKSISSLFYIFPVVMFLSGTVFFFFPMATTAWLVIFAGAWIMVYGISEIVGFFVIG
ncbi:MAG: DUF308 domain-containing protein, partial [Mucinivorans sp.]